MHILLLSMPTNTVIETSEGQWSLTPQFFAKFARAFGDIALELDSDHDDEPGTGGRVSIENDMLTLPRPAQFSRARRRN